MTVNLTSSVIQETQEPYRPRMALLFRGNMAQKPFKTFTEQIEILRSRNMIITEECKAIQILSEVNYYNLINAYKNPFLTRDSSGNIQQPETYVQNCHLKDLYAFYCLDRELRGYFLNYMLRFEKHLKTICAYKFSEKYPNDYSYLNISNYSHDKKDFDSVLKNMANISNEISRNIDPKNMNSVSYYHSQHDSIPLWVLINHLTIGNVSYFLRALDVGLRDAISREFSDLYKVSYSKSDKIGHEELLEIVKLVNFFRNACAHDRMFLNYYLNKPIKKSIFAKFFPSTILFKGRTAFDLLCVLKLVISKDDFSELAGMIHLTFEKYKNQLTCLPIFDIIQSSGFTRNWKDILK